MSRLTLVLSCAMKFESYPHDTQICSMLIESRKLESISIIWWVGSFIFIPVAVSHTVQDLVFIWNMTDPLVVNDDIELPQQDISKIYTTDCTIAYR